MLKDFKKFLFRGNLVDLAVGFTVGAAFSTVAKSLVEDVIMPPVGLILGKADFSNLYILIKPGDKQLPPYTDLSQAKAFGAVTINYGKFLNNVIALILVALAMYLLIKMVNQLEKEIEVRTAKDKSKKLDILDQKKCPFCYSIISYKATRCPQCTSQLKPPSKNNA